MPEASRFLEKILANNFPSSDAEDNTSGHDQNFAVEESQFHKFGFI